MEIQWSLVLFTALTGMGGWMFACVAADEFLKKAPSNAFPASVVAIIAMIAGGLASVTHLSHPDRIMGALGHPTSGIFTEAVLVGLACVFIAIFLVLVKRNVSSSARRVVAVIGAIIGVVLSFSAGASYMMSAQLSWDTVLLPIGYMATSIPLGVAAYLAVALFQKGSETAKANAGSDADVSSVNADAVVMTSDGSAAAVQGSTVTASASTISAIDSKEMAVQLDPYIKALWIGGIIATVCALAYGALSGQIAVAALLLVITILGSGIAPIVCGLMIARKSKSLHTLVWVSAVAALIGSIAFRCMMWVIASPVANFFLNSF